MRGILALVAASIVYAAAAFAQAPPAPMPDPALPPRYEVEIIVFAHRDFDPAEERFDTARRSFGTGSAATLLEAPAFDDTTFAPPVTEPPVTEPFPPTPVDPVAAARAEAFTVRPLAPEELKLGTEYRKLQALSAYQPLVHAGWVLPGLPEAESVPFDLKALGVSNPRGTVRVHLSRFLHITLDLTYQALSASVPAPSASDGLDEIALAPQYRLETTRSARSNELHYFDHPAFGVLVRITPVPAQNDTGRRPAA
jgi:hypothetical protein